MLRQAPTQVHGVSARPAHLRPALCSTHCVACSSHKHGSTTRSVIRSTGGSELGTVTRKSAATGTHYAQATGKANVPIR